MQKKSYCIHCLIQQQGSDETLLLAYFEEVKEIEQSFSRLAPFLKDKETLVDTSLIDLSTSREIAHRILNIKKNDLLRLQDLQLPALRGKKEVGAVYWAELSLIHSSQRVQKAFGYFSAINEFYELLSWVSNKATEEVDLSIQIFLLDSPQKDQLLSSRTYRIQASGQMCIPDDPVHYLNFKSVSGLEKFSLFIWENDLLQLSQKNYT